MPLHDWSTVEGWSGVHTAWLVEISRAIRPQLPQGYRAYIGTSPMVAIDDPPGEPDVTVRHANGHAPAAPNGPRAAAEVDSFHPDREVLVATIVGNRVVYVEKEGRLVAAVELISPGNKDRPSRRVECTNRFLGYLMNGVHLMLIDLHPSPRAFSFADELASRLGIADEPALLPAFATSYRVGEADRRDGSYLALRRQHVNPGEALPMFPLALTEQLTVSVDLESTYMRAAADAYLT